MTLRELLGMLRNVRGPSAKGEYVCQCPAHDDKHASLWVNEGDKGIIMKCQAGCSKDEILRALGISVYDLLDSATRAEWDRKAEKKGVDPRKMYDGNTPARRSAPPAAKPAPAKREMKTFDSYEAAYGRLGKLVCCYPYTDSNGTLLFEVARIQTRDGKTFRQHRPADPEKGLFPIVCSVPAEIRGHTIYRQAEVAAAVRAGRTVYVVEGEKDADTIASFGYCGTTSPMGADHWEKGHSEHLRGADVVVIPDADSSGAKYGQAIVDSTTEIAKSVRVIRLRDAYPGLPDKGDITDLAELVGTDQARDMLNTLVEKAEPCTVNLYQKAVAAYNALYGYCVDHGCICQAGETNPKTLGTFVALPTMEVTRDDGAQEIKWLEICGWASDSRPLKKLLVPLSKFRNMDWALEGWGLDANIMPGNTVRDRLRSAITSAGAMVAKKKTIYTHTGWRKINGEWCYLYQGGCIGADGITVEMEEGLTSYTLGDRPDNLSPLDAALTSFSLTHVIAEHVSVPLLAVCYLAPLREFLQQAGAAPAFITMLRGGSGTGKSVAASLALSHFGRFSENSMPASFGDTANGITRKAFLLKDMPLLVDDYHPTTSIQERRRMEQVAQRLSRAFGNQASRGRMSADLTLQVSMPPQCVAIVTGEESPDIGDSGIARSYIVDVEKGDVLKYNTSGKEDIAANRPLTQLQQQARSGELQAAMRGYIEWLQPQADALPQHLSKTFLAYRERAGAMLSGMGAHSRAPSAIAHLMIGLTCMLEYFTDLGMCDQETAAATLDEYWEIIVGESVAQVKDNQEESAVQLFLTAASEMMASGVLTVIDITPGSPCKVPAKGMTGYADKDFYYLMGETVYGAVAEFYRKQDRIYPISRAALFKQLREQNIIMIGSDGKSTKVKRTPDGKTRRLLWIPRWRLDGGKPPEPPAHQEKMAFVPVADDDIPDEFK